MPVETIVHKSKFGIIQKWTGHVTALAFLSNYKELLADPAYGEYRFWVEDFSEATKISFTRDEIDEVIRLNKEGEKINPNYIVALIASETLIFGLSRMWEMMTAEISWEKKVFRNRDDAYLYVQSKMKEKHGLSIQF